MFLTLVCFVSNFHFLSKVDQWFKTFVKDEMPVYASRLSNEQFQRYTSNVPALVNASWCSFYALSSLLMGNFSMPTMPLAYFVYDFLRGCSSTMAVHHLVGFSLLVAFSDFPIKRCSSLVLLIELSTVFLCLLNILKGERNNPRTLSNDEIRTSKQLETAFVVSFFLFRILFFPAVVMYGFSFLNWFLFVLLLFLYWMNLCWLKIIVEKF